jgi:RNA polymerase sigma-70 factor (ECF subfamily)
MEEVNRQDACGGLGCSDEIAFEDTRITLIERIQNPDDTESWERFVAIYSPGIYRFCRSKGIGHSDAEDLTQEVIRAVLGSIGRFEYREGKAKFRSWMYQVTRNIMNTRFGKQSRRPNEDGSTVAQRAAENMSEDEEMKRWENDYRARLFEWATGEIKSEFNPRIWEVFWRTAVDGDDPDEVARESQMSRAAVYVAKSRCLARLREKIEKTGEAWESELVSAS